ncbi:MAG: FHA domain-containing protein [Myxococcota bacterium]
MILADLVQQRKELDLEAFLEAWPVPVLLHRPEGNDLEERAFKTGITDPRASRLELEAGLSTSPDLEVIKVEKRPGGPFKDRISVGRTRTNDIQIEYPKISKFHAYFTTNEDGTSYRITDAGSTNGTFVNGHLLTEGKPVVLPDRAMLGFGRYNFRFHLPQGLFHILGEIAFGG